MPTGIRKAILSLAILAFVPVGCASSAATSAPSVEPMQPATRAPSPAGSIPSSHPTPAPTATPSLPLAGSVRATINGVGPISTVNGDYYGIAADDTDVWVYNGEIGTLVRIATSTDTVVATVKLTVGCENGRGCGNVAIGEGAVWVANVRDGTITRVDTTTNRIVATISVGNGAAPQVYATPGAIWSANYLTDTYSRINPTSDKISTTLPDHSGAESVVFAFGSIWLCDADWPMSLTRLDGATLHVTAHVDLTHEAMHYLCFDAVATDQSILVAAVSDYGAGGSLERVDPATNSVSAAVAGPGIAGVERGFAATATQGWVIDSALGLFGLDPLTARPVSHLTIPTPAGLATGAASVWVVSTTGSVYRITPTA